MLTEGWWGKHTDSFLLDGADFFLIDLEVHGDSGGLDRDTALLLVLSRVRKPHVSRLCGSNDTGLGDQGIGEGGFTVID